MPQYTFEELDPRTKQPVQQPAVQQPPQAQTQPIQNQPPAQQQPPAFDIEKFAADSATRQLLFAMRQNPNFHPTNQDYEDARKAAYQQGFETQRQMQLDSMRQQAELNRQKQMYEFQQFAPRNMTEGEIKDASNIMGAHNQIMMLYNQNADIPANHPYRTAYVGQPLAEGIAKETDPRIRLYEATRGGSIISLGRGLLQDTGQVAGKEQAQDLIKQLMPGPGDSPEMAARKSVDMMSMEMNGLQSKINALPQNVDSTPLKQAYAHSYTDYANLVNQYGSPAQKQFPMLSPNQLGWTTTTPPVQVQAPNQPAVKAGTSPQFSQTVTDTVNAQAAGQAPPQHTFQELDPKTNQPINQPSVRPQITPESPTFPTDVGAATQQAGQQAGGSQVWTPENMPIPQTPSAQVVTGKDVRSAAGALGQRAKDVTVEAGQEAQSGLSSILSFLNPDTWKEFQGQ